MCRLRRFIPRATAAFRRAPRLAPLAYVALDDTNGGIVLNISETGMAVAAAESLVLAEYLPLVRFQLPSTGQSIKISAQVVWLAESKKSRHPIC